MGNEDLRGRKNQPDYIHSKATAPVKNALLLLEIKDAYPEKIINLFEQIKLINNLPLMDFFKESAFKKLGFLPLGNMKPDIGTPLIFAGNYSLTGSSGIVRNDESCCELGLAVVTSEAHQTYTKGWLKDYPFVISFDYVLVRELYRRNNNSVADFRPLPENKQNKRISHSAYVKSTYLAPFPK